MVRRQQFSECFAASAVIRARTARPPTRMLPPARGRAAPRSAGAGGAGTGGTAIGGSAGGGASSVIPSISLGGTSSSKMAVLFDGRVQRAERAAPISGGTLEVARDGASAVAADADRDRLFVVDLVRRSVREVATQPG